MNKARWGLRRGPQPEKPRKRRIHGLPFTLFGPKGGNHGVIASVNASLVVLAFIAR